MAKVSLLVDTDVFVDYFNTGRFHVIFDPGRFLVYYSTITKKELLTKPGLRDSERQAIVTVLDQCRIVPLSNAITKQYSELRSLYPSIDKADALIAATALTKRLPLLTRNRRHFKIVVGLDLFGE